MDKEIKKKLASNWFKLLQNTICNDIEKLEGKRVSNKLDFTNSYFKKII